MYPLVVIEDKGKASASNGVARAEKVLDGAVAQLAAADVAARPVARLDFSLAAGILRARRELLGTDVIVGLSERTTAPEFFFGSMLSLAEVFAALKIDAWLAEAAARPLAPLAASPPLFLVAVGLVGYAVNLVVRWQAACVLMTLVLHTTCRYRLEFGRSLADQDRALQGIASLLSGTDMIYVHGSGDVLVLLARANANPLLLMEFGVDEFAAARRGIGFEALLQELARKRPRVVVLSRLQNGRRRAALEDWVRQAYSPVTIPGYRGVFLRLGIVIHVVKSSS